MDQTLVSRNSKNWLKQEFDIRFHIYAWIFSITLHVLLGVIGFQLLGTPQKKTYEVEVQKKTTFVKIKRPHSNLSARLVLQEPLPTRSKKIKEASIQTLNLKDLNIGIKVNQQPQTDANDSEENSGTNNADVTTGNGMPVRNSLGVDIQEESKDHPLFSFIYEKIDQNLTYPVELTEKSISGTVTVHIIFSREGKYQESSTLFRSISSPYLKVLVAKTLRRAFEDPIPKIKLTRYDRFSANCSFNFRISNYNYETLLQPRNFATHTELLFDRHHRSGLSSSNSGAINLLSLDLLSVGRKKIEIDPLEKYRNDPSW